MNHTRWLKAAIPMLACMVLAGGRQAAAQIWDPITNCYHDPAGLAPPVCPNGPHGGLAPRPPKDNRPDTWGAIAVSPSTLSWGKSWKHASDSAARAAALSECARHAPDCRVAISTFDYCMALATSPRQKIWATGGPHPFAKDAATLAVIHCKRAGGEACAVVTTACTDG